MTPYETLGVPPNATADDIKRAFRQVSKATHPDAHPDNPEAAERFRRASDAYAILSDPVKRRRYDETGEAQTGALSEAETVLMQMTDAVLGMVPQGTNVVEFLQAEIRANGRQLAAEVAKVETQVAKARALVPQLVSAGPVNLLATVAERKLGAAEESLAVLRAAVVTGEQMLELLASYRHELPRQMTGADGAPGHHSTPRRARGTSVFWDHAAG